MNLKCFPPLKIWINFTSYTFSYSPLTFSYHKDTNPRDNWRVFKNLLCSSLITHPYFRTESTFDLCALFSSSVVHWRKLHLNLCGSLNQKNVFAAEGIWSSYQVKAAEINQPVI